MHPDNFLPKPAMVRGFLFLGSNETRDGVCYSEVARLGKLSEFHHQVLPKKEVLGAAKLRVVYTGCVRTGVSL
ncbi:hypothetical protein [Microcoleus sp. bin38.metabat.b11b12b14.051]|uniref:hypothetical protein n=1 Tax=Microcoleus sp. bin38.metabat.b11b12b14.051 TaxID=2742709 RepID=UPI0025CDD03D|nr:hypothetical protein [Microcoleus sp. bin38.metabat.b11b12b14.051]